MTRSGGLTFMEAKRPWRTERILSSCEGSWFNSVNDVVVGRDGGVWFTDPDYGTEQDFRPRPRLPCLVFRYVGLSVCVVSGGGGWCCVDTGGWGGGRFLRREVVGL